MRTPQGLTHEGPRPRAVSLQFNTRAKAAFHVLSRYVLRKQSPRHSTTHTPLSKTALRPRVGVTCVTHRSSNENGKRAAYTCFLNSCLFDPLHVISAQSNERKMVSYGTKRVCFSCCRSRPLRITRMRGSTDTSGSARLPATTAAGSFQRRYSLNSWGGPLARERLACREQTET